MTKKKLTADQLKNLKRALRNYAQNAKTDVVEQDGIVYVEVAKTPWSALEPFFPKGWTKDEVRAALNEELIGKPYAKEIYRNAKLMKSRLSVF